MVSLNSKQIEVNDLLTRIHTLSKGELDEFEKLIRKAKKKSSLSNSRELKNQDQIEKILHKLIDDSKCSILAIRLAKHIQEDWSTIKTGTLLTKFLIKTLEKFEKIEDQSIFFKRINKGSESGSYFETKIGEVIDWYLSSQIEIMEFTEKSGC